jgi:hypothetical protein
MSRDTERFLDGNVAAGELREVFAVDLTGAVGQCGNCGKRAVLAEVRVYTLEPGLVARCGGCEHVLMRLVKGSRHAWLDLRGLIYLQLPVPPQAPTLPAAGTAQTTE